MQALTPFVASEKAGALLGSLDVLPDGMAGYSIPIEAPAWRGGVQPSLSLRYDGGTGNGWLGVGWTLDGLSMISRCNKTFANDGEPASIGLGKDDAVCLDGARLVAIDGADLVTTTTYRTNPETFARVTVTGRDTLGQPTGFKVELKNGRIRYYGGASGFRVEAKPRITNPDGSLAGFGDTRALSWLLQSEQDRSGNTFSINYTKLPAGGQLNQVEYVPSSIVYGNRRIDLQFCGDEQDASCTGSPRRPDPLERWTAGIQSWITRRLRKITVSAPSVPGSTLSVTRSYNLQYTQSAATRRSLLSNVTLCDGAGVCLHPTLFAYTGVAPSFAASAGILSPGFTNFTAAAGLMHVADFNGDGRDDVVYVKSTDFHWYIRFGINAAPWLGAETPQPSLPPCRDCKARPVDVNRDGKTDLMVEVVEPAGNAATVTARFFLANSTGLGAANGAYDISIPQPLPPSDPDAPPQIYRLDPMITFADMNGDGMVDVFFRKPTSSTTYGDIVSHRGQAGGGWVSHALFAWPSTGYEVAQWQLTDLDGEGRAELIYHHTANTYGPRRVGTRSLTGTVETVTETPPANLTADSCNVFVDLNGDGLLDVANVRHGIDVRMNLGSYRFGPPASVLPAVTDPDFDFEGVKCDPFYNSHGELNTDRGVRVGDVDGDGKDDLVVFYRTDGRTNVHWFRAAEQVGTDSMTPIVIGRSLPVPVRQDGNLGGSAAAQLADFNGDGRVDFIQAGPHANETRAQILVQLGEAPDLLKRATNGVARVDEVDYEHLATSTAYTRELCVNVGGHPTMCQQRPGIAVVRTKVDDGSGLRPTFEYTYDARRIDLMGGGDLGFSIRTIKDVRLPADPSDPNRTKNPLVRIWSTGNRSGDPNGKGYYLHDAQPTLIETSVFDPVEQRWHFTSRTHDNATKLAFDGKTRIIWQRRQQHRDFSGPTANNQGSDAWSSVRRTTVEIDSYGNETSRLEEIGDGMSSTTSSTRTDTSYAAENPAAWLIGLPTHVVQTSSSWNAHAAQMQSQTRNTALRYDANTGLLARAVVEPSAPDALDSGTLETYLNTLIARNSYGQPTQIAKYRIAFAVSGISDNTWSQTTRYVYDADSVHIVQTTPAAELPQLVTGLDPVLWTPN